MLRRAVAHSHRSGPLRLYGTGLLLPGERKSVEPMAARLAPGGVRPVHQGRHHLVADSPWSARRLLAAIRHYAPHVPGGRRCAGVDRGRHGRSEEGPPIGGSHASALRCPSTARGLAARPPPLRGQRAPRPADRLRDPSAGVLGDRSEAANEGGCPRRRPLPYEARDRHGPASSRSRGRGSPRGSPGRGRIRQQHALP
ncbi:MAG: transposase [Thermoanaerobaculia bacterium]|nr:transposase [Thermoanaerobaculia bacterium]